MGSSSVAEVGGSRPPIGALLRQWRAARRMSQMDLALDAELSTRHLSCIETGKAQASRETIARLAEALDLPLRERNALLLAAGYAPRYAENTLVTPALERMRQAIELIIRHQEPYPAFVINRRFDVLMANDAAVRVNALLMKGRRSPHANLLRQVFDPDDFRSVIVNWPEVAEKFIRHLHEDLAAVPSDQTARQLLDEVLRYPGVPARWRFRDVEVEASPVLTLVFRSDEGELRFFETITTFSTPRDVTLDELRIECAFPADDHTAKVCARLARADAV
ncbi:helix-turn-helix domain-containing protein [Caulobacter sp. LARHSG274]